MVHISDLKNNQCRWMDGEGSSLLYCGDPTLPGKSWCERHYMRVFVPRLRAVPKPQGQLNASSNDDPLRAFR
jgi:hypothetical protein